MFCFVFVLTGCRIASDFLALPSDFRISSSFNSHFPSPLHNLKLLAKSFNPDNLGDPTVTIPSLNNKFFVLATHAYTFGIDLFLTLCSVMSFCNVLLESMVTTVQINELESDLWRINTQQKGEEGSRFLSERDHKILSPMLF